MLLWRDPTSLLLGFQTLATYFFKGLAGITPIYAILLLPPPVKGCFESLPWPGRYIMAPLTLPPHLWVKTSEKSQFLTSCSARLNGPRLRSPTRPKGERGLVPSSIAPTHPQPHLSPETRAPLPRAGSGRSRLPPRSRLFYLRKHIQLSVRRSSSGSLMKLGLVSALRVKRSSKISKNRRTENANLDFTVQEGITYKSDPSSRLRYRCCLPVFLIYEGSATLGFLNLICTIDQQSDLC